MKERTHMASEIAECAAAVARQRVPAIALGRPTFAVTCARGSSANATLLLRYLIETRLGLAVSESAPASVTLLGANLAMRDALFVTVSQSGRSPDLVAATRAAATAGARTIAVVNDPSSPLATAAWQAVDMAAGPELSVAATKSVVASMAAAARLVCAWSGDGALHAALERLPDRLAEAGRLDWSGFFRAAGKARCVFVIGRGYGLAAAREISLKLSETLLVPAVSYSAAEFMHGPRAGVGPATPVLLLKSGDATDASVDDAARQLRATGADVHVVGEDLPWLSADHPALDPIAMLVPAYAGIEISARAAGLDPDRPPQLSKVTMTL